jgi:D-glycero-D-manno-heptose 1,7-bisphosphate phosphatase
MTNRREAVFFDRDGVLNQAFVRDGKPYPPVSLEELVILPGVAEGLRQLAEAGYLLIGVTNQPDVARGTQSRETVVAINTRIQSQLGLHQVYTCFHDDADNCACRKPKPGLILHAAKDYGLDLTRSWMVGDRWKDIAAGKSAGLQTIFIDYYYREAFHGTPADYNVADTSAAVKVILENAKKLPGTVKPVDK